MKLSDACCDTQAEPKSDPEDAEDVTKEGPL